MLFRLRNEADYRRMIAAGQFSMVAALPILAAGVWIRLTHSVPAFLLKLAPAGFWEGFFVGLGVTLALFSAFMNVRGIRAWRKHEQDR